MQGTAVIYPISNSSTGSHQVAGQTNQIDNGIVNASYNMQQHDSLFPPEYEVGMIIISDCKS